VGVSAGTATDTSSGCGKGTPGAGVTASSPAIKTSTSGSPRGFYRRPPRRHLGVASGLHITVDLLDCPHFHAERAPRRHTLFGAAGAHRLHENFLRRDRPVRLERDDEVWCERRTERVLPVTAGAVEIELLPSVIHVLSHGIARSLVILIPELLSHGSAGADRHDKQDGRAEDGPAGGSDDSRAHYESFRWQEFDPTGVNVMIYAGVRFPLVSAGAAGVVPAAFSPPSPFFFSGGMGKVGTEYSISRF